MGVRDRVPQDGLGVGLSHFPTIKDLLFNQQKLAMAGKLSGGVIHQIKNPLGFVKQFANTSFGLVVELEDIIARCKSKLSESDKNQLDVNLAYLKDSIKEISDSAETISRLSDIMLSQYRNAVVVPVKLNSLIEDTVNLTYHSMRARVKQFNTTIKYNLDKSIGMANLSSDFNLVIFHLTDNAFYSTHAKKLADSSFRPELTVNTKYLGAAIELRVRDNGLGIPEETIGKVFDPFFTTKPGEFGLGLTLVKDIVNRHGGKIEANSSSGDYAEFVLNLPKSVLT